MSAWNPSDLGTFVVLSNGNHTVSNNSFLGNTSGVRGSKTHTYGDGLFYMEFTATYLQPGASNFIGMTDANSTINSNATINKLFMFETGFVVGASGTYSLGAFTSSDTICLAIDLNSKFAWIRINGGTWVGDGTGTADPTLGSSGHGISISGYSPTTFYPGAWLQNSNGTGPTNPNPEPTTTVNLGDSAFNFSMPSGYVAWDNSPAPNRFYSTLIM